MATLSPRNSVGMTAEPVLSLIQMYLMVSGPEGPKRCQTTAATAYNGNSFARLHGTILVSCNFSDDSKIHQRVRTSIKVSI